MRRNCILLRIYGSRQEKEVDRKRKQTGKGSRQEKEGERKRKQTGKGSRQEKEGERKGKWTEKGRIQAFCYTYLRSAWNCIELA